MERREGLFTKLKAFILGKKERVEEPKIEKKEPKATMPPFVYDEVMDHLASRYDPMASHYKREYHGYLCDEDPEFWM